MPSLLRKFWNDDRGAVISVELVLILGVLVMGVIPGLVAMRNSINASLGNLANVVSSVSPSFTFSGFAITQAGQTIVQVQGVQVDAATGNLVSASQLPPLPYQAAAIMPAP